MSKPIKTYLSKLFIADEFKVYVVDILIFVKNVWVETYHLRKIIKWYYGPLQQVWSIIITKIIDIKLYWPLHIFFGVIKSSVGSNRPVFILLIFFIYLRRMKLDLLSLFITQRVMVINKTLHKMKKYSRLREIYVSFNVLNRFFIILILNSQIYEQMFLYLECKDWWWWDKKGVYNFSNI